MSQMFLALACALLTLLCCHSLLAATVRPYKFGFTIEEQQHRSESRDENGIVMGEFGFITADGIYHVTVYATDENGKFRIISMKNFPYAGPKAPKSPPPTTSTQRIPTPVTKHNFHTVACSGCFLGNSSPDPKSNPASAEGNRSTKNEIRPLSQPLSPAAAAVPGVKPVQQPISTVGNAAPRPAVTATQQQQQPTSKTPLAGAQPNQRPQPVSSSFDNLNLNLGATLPQPATGNSANFKPALGGTQVQQRPQPSGGSLASFIPTAAVQPAVAGTKQVQPPSSGSATYTPTNTAPQSTTNKASKSTTSTGAAGSADLSGDLYKFKYLLDYNGHEETGSRNGDKVGNYFAIGDDAVERIVEYIANEFGFQPHISWRKLEGKEASLPAENSLKHYEFKWFNKDTE
ncbi:protein lethal(3)malignant blood neoplasm 1 isoform X2 [Drosophila mojavensis]|uniref:protein lethal(3)malignant blood neoplasm 1 isoform X2 n=1 Tax=Drosophila mojavensis TaxID=7230 RepID=UPI001CD1574E|nr:protein lethal(3)malignant blood neoplasm 1 isoform X2 [Drosophila mojavensis]